MENSISIRDRARGALRGELADVALGLFEDRGYDDTTVDDISTAAGISPRTFYRYFGTKEDALVADLPPTPEDLRELLESHLTALPPWEALHQTLRSTAEPLSYQRQRWSRLLRVVNTSDTLRAGHLERRMNLAQSLIPTVAPHLDAPRASSELRATVLVHTALTCLDIALAHWAKSDEDAEILESLDIAFKTFPSSDLA